MAACSVLSGTIANHRELSGILFDHPGASKDALGYDTVYLGGALATYASGSWDPVNPEGSWKKKLNVAYRFTMCC